MQSNTDFDDTSEVMSQVSNTIGNHFCVYKKLQKFDVNFTKSWVFKLQGDYWPPEMFLKWKIFEYSICVCAVLGYFFYLRYSINKGTAEEMNNFLY